MKKIMLLLSFVLLATSLQAELSFSEFSAKKDQEKVERYYNISTQLLRNYGDDESRDAEKYLIKAIALMEQKKMDMNSFLAAEIYRALGFAYYSIPDYRTPLTDEIKLYKKSVLYYEKSVAIKMLLVKQDPNRYTDTLKKSKKSVQGAKNQLAKAQKKLSK